MGLKILKQDNKTRKIHMDLPCVLKQRVELTIGIELTKNLC